MNTRNTELLERLQYTFSTGSYPHIDKIVSELRKKPHWDQLVSEFFSHCYIDDEGCLVRNDFFEDSCYSAYMEYALYSLLGAAHDNFVLKFRVRTVSLIDDHLDEPFTIPPGLFHLPVLTTLKIEDKGLEAVPPAIALCRESLQHLSLRQNHLSELPKEFWKLRNLCHLDLSGNRLESIPDEIGRLKKLRIADFSRNKIHSLSPRIDRLSLLRELDLSINTLSSLPESLGFCSHLTCLRTAYNAMSATEEASWDQMPLFKPDPQEKLFSSVP